MNQIKIRSGTYTADSEVTVSLNLNSTQISYVVYRRGEEIDIPAANEKIGYWYSVDYYPEFGDRMPELLRVVEATP